jgi:hypothetical protein
VRVVGWWWIVDLSVTLGNIFGGWDEDDWKEHQILRLMAK